MQVDGPIPKPLDNKEDLRRLIAAKLASRPPANATIMWARLAAAASDLPEYLNELEDLLLPYESVPWEDIGGSARLLQPTALVDNIVAMLSAWTVLCSPTINNFSVTASLSGLAAHRLAGDVWRPSQAPGPTIPDSQMSFCLAMGVLGNTVLNNMPLLAHRAMDLHKPEAWGNRELRRELEASFTGTQAIGLFTLGCMPWLLRSDPGVLIRDDLPRPEKLPLLQSNGDIPLPDTMPPCQGGTSVFSEVTRASNLKFLDVLGLQSSWSRWLRSNIDSLLDTIVDGEWMGYVTTSQGRNGDVPPPAKGIRFTTLPHPHDPQRLLLAAEDGVDGRGPFCLNGYLERSMGRVRLTKRWVESNAPAHVLVGTMTPLGIVGCWAYHGAGGIPMGFMWMYKKEWTREAP
ncbi:hypothetical protein B0T16DRAFT_112819 [Cercophora newfieldiana]|uniref:Uncharacterized protein n=1 Tax=Cercophora newfieldiana TaxID=92897 RepID=A0AA40CR52_9PEZI|nr:hypothetical protein B0T16DRAFT_112819 [Cercophora newfieldiana]